MTIADPHSSLIPPALVGRRVRVVWQGAVTAACDPLGAWGDVGNAGRIEMIVEVTIREQGLVDCTAWLELPGGRRKMLDPAPAVATARLEGSRLHMDVHRLDRTRILALSYDLGQDRLLMARTTLWSDLGLRAGMLDPPRNARASIERDAASA